MYGGYVGRYFRVCIIYSYSYNIIIIFGCFIDRDIVIWILVYYINGWCMVIFVFDVDFYISFVV